MKLIQGDCLVEMNRLSEKTVNCIITSPPYNVDLGNNKYKKEGYNSHNDNMPYQEYLSWMSDVFRESYRVLSEDGRLCVNVGDGKNGKIPTTITKDEWVEYSNGLWVFSPEKQQKIRSSCYVSH